MAITWVGGTTAAFATATSITAAAPSGLATGDTLLAFVFARSNPTTPSGWTQVAATSCSDGFITQRLRCYKKDSVSSGDSGANFTFSAASSGRIGVTFAAVRGAGTISSGTNFSNSVYSYLIAPSAVGVTDATGALFICAATTIDQSAGAETPTYQAGWSLWTGSGLSIYRLAGGYRFGTYDTDVPTAGGGGGTIDMSSIAEGGAVLNALASLTLVLEPEATVDPEAYLSAAGPLGAPALQAWVGSDPFVLTSAASPLGASAMLAMHDFTSLIDPGAPEYYACDLIDGDTTLRVPISSWQGTLQLNSSSYLQAVIPAVFDLADAIQALSVDAEIVISRGARVFSGQSVEVEIARSVIEQVQLDQGPQRYTCTISGYSGAFVAPAVAYAETDRQLTGVRSISSGSGGVRVRCAIDWLLRPGQMAIVDGTTFEASYINYYAQARESYMDVGERAA